jgi:hypothetical protein
MQKVGVQRGLRLAWLAAALAGIVTVLVLTAPAPAALHHRARQTRSGNQRRTSPRTRLTGLAEERTRLLRTIEPVR